MPVNQEALLYTLTSFADVFYDFFLGKPKDVTFKYMDQNGNIKTITVANIAKAKQNLEKSAVTDDELAKTLKDYYKKVEVDKIRDTIMKNFDNYYKKSEVNSKINDVKTDYINRVNAAKKALDSEIDNIRKTLANTEKDLNNKITTVDNRTVMTEAEYQALAEARRKMFAGSGVVEFGNTFSGLTDPYRFTLKDLWNHSWPGCCSFRTQTDPGKYAYYGKTAKVLHWSRGEWGYIGGSINPVLNVNGNRIVIRGINQSKAFESCIKNVIEFPEAPTAKAIIKDSTSLPANMRQGDFAILKDLDRELIQTPDEHVEKGCSVEKDDNGNYVVKTIDTSKPHAFYFRFNRKPLIRNVKYRFSFKIVDWEDDNIDFYFRPFIINNKFTPFGFNTSDLTKGETLEVEFTVKDNINNNNMYISIPQKDKSITITDFKLYQVEEQPVVALRDIESGVDVYQNSEAFEGRESISRQDLVFLEVWNEDIAEKDFVYPFGNVQYQGGNVDGLSSIDKGTFKGADTYSLFGNWQEPGTLIGKGYKWSQLSEGDKIKLASNPDNNIRRKGDKWIQTRYRVRVVKGLGNDWHTIKADTYGGGWDRFFGYPYIIRPLGDRKVKGDFSVYGNGQALVDDYAHHYDNFTLGLSKIKYPGLWDNPTKYSGTYEQSNGGGIYALPLVLVQRRNDGVYNKIFNPEGTAQAYDKENSRLLKFEEYALDGSFVTSLEDCFDASKTAAVTSSGSVVPADDSGSEYRSGYVMSKISGCETGLFADEINERDVEDLRMRAEKKPYKEILDEYLQKAINTEIRGKESNEFIKVIELVGKNDCSGSDYNYLLDDGSNNFLPRLLNIPYGTGTYYLASKGIKNAIAINNRNGEVGYIQHIWYNQDRSYFGFHLSDYNVPNRKTSLPHKLIHANAGDKYTIILIFNKDYTYNNTTEQTDIIGDPRKLKDRVSLTVGSSDTTVALKHNTYVLCNDATKNSGTAGHYYRYIGSDLNSIHTNSTNGNANAEGGHIDFSDTDKWVDLGNNGNIGGYPDVWLEKGFQGTPLLLGENGESLLPIDAKIYPNPNNNAVIGFDNYNKGLYVKLTKKLKRLRRVLVRKKDGSWLNYDLTRYNESLHAATGNGWKLEIKNRIYVNLNDESISALGYNSLNEALDLIQIIATYDAYADFLESTDNNKVLEINKQVQISGDKLMNNSSTDVISNNLLNKIITTQYDNLTGLSLQTFNKDKGGHISSSYEHLLHTDINVATNINGKQNLTSPMVKHVSYLTEVNKIAYLQFIFKELKFSSDPKLTIKAGVYLNNEYLDGQKRSYTVAHFNTAGKLIGIKSFDAYGNSDEAKRMTSYLNNIPVNNIVAISSYDEPRGNVAGNSNLKAAMAKCGASTSILSKLEYRSSYALIGIKTGQVQGTKLVESYSPRYSDPVRIEYKTDDFTIRVESIGFDSKATLDKTASWGDDNKFQITNKVSTVTDLNGEKVLIGQKRVALPYFITD